MVDWSILVSAVSFPVKFQPAPGPEHGSRLVVTYLVETGPANMAGPLRVELLRTEVILSIRGPENSRRHLTMTAGSYATV